MGGVANAQADDASVFAHVPVAESAAQLSSEGKQRVLAQLAFFRGARYQGRGNFSAAQVEFESALAFDPTNVELAMRLARIAMTLNQPQRGLQVLRDSLTNNIDQPKAYLHLAEFCENVADQLDRQAATDDSGTSESEAAMIRVQAEDVSLMALEKFPQYPSVYWQLLRLYLAQNRKEHARAMMERAIARDDADPFYWLEMGSQAQQAWPLSDRERTDEHLKIINAIYDRAIDTAGENAEVIDQVADFFSQTRQYDRAVELYRRVIELNPGMLLAREKLARVLGVLERHEEKLSELTKLVQINPYDVRIQKFIGNEFQGRGDPSRAIHHFLEAIKAGENEAVFFHDLVQLMLAEGMVEEALPVVRRAHFLYPESFSLTVQLARVLAGAKDWDEALRAYRTAEKLVDEEKRPELLDDEFFFEFGSVAQEAGLPVRAAHLFRKSTASVPKQEPQRAAKAYAALASVWLDQGERVAEAVELLGLAIDLEPDTPAYFTSLGRCHYLKGEHALAVEALRKAAELTADDPSPVVLNHLAMALFRSGNRTQAVITLERAIELEGADSEMRARLDSYRKGEDFDPLPVTDGSE